MSKYDELRYEYMARILGRIKKDSLPADMERLHKMFEGLCYGVAWSLSEKYNVHIMEIEGIIYAEFMMLVQLYRIGSDMTVTSFLKQWLYLKSDRSIRQFLGKDKKNRKVKKFTVTSLDNVESEGNFAGSVSENASAQHDFSFHMEFSEFIDIIRKKLKEIDVDMLIMFGLYGMSNKQIGDIVGMEPDKVGRKINAIKKILVEKTYGEK